MNRIKKKRVVLAGDFNIAHQEIDLARSQQNKSNIMFTKEEREEIGKLIKLGFVDSLAKKAETTPGGLTATMRGGEILVGESIISLPQKR